MEIESSDDEMEWTEFSRKGVPNEERAIDGEFVQEEEEEEEKDQDGNWESTMAGLLSKLPESPISSQSAVYEGHENDHKKEEDTHSEETNSPSLTQRLWDKLPSSPTSWFKNDNDNEERENDAQETDAHDESSPGTSAAADEVVKELPESPMFRARKSPSSKSPISDEDESDDQDLEKAISRGSSLGQRIMSKLPSSPIRRKTNNSTSEREIQSKMASLSDFSVVDTDHGIGSGAVLELNSTGEDNVQRSHFSNKPVKSRDSEEFLESKEPEAIRTKFSIFRRKSSSSSLNSGESSATSVSKSGRFLRKPKSPFPKGLFKKKGKRQEEVDKMSEGSQGPDSFKTAKSDRRSQILNPISWLNRSRESTPRSTGSSLSTKFKRSRFWSNASLDDSFDNTSSIDERSRINLKPSLKSFKKKAKHFLKSARGKTSSRRSDSKGESFGFRNENEKFTSNSDQVEIESGRDDGDEEYESSFADTEEEEEEQKAYLEEIRTCIAAFYILHNPHKLEDIPKLMAKYDGHEEHMLVKLAQKYAAEVPEIDEAKEIIAAHKAEKTSSFGTVKKIRTKSKPKPMVGVLYNEHDHAILLELRSDFISRHSFEELLDELLENHSYFLKGIEKQELLRCLERFETGQLDLKGKGAKSQIMDIVMEHEARILNAEIDAENDEDLDIMWEGRNFDSSAGDVQERQKMRMVADGSTFRDRWGKETLNAWKRRMKLLDKTLFELIDSERQYVHEIETINDLVIVPLLNSIEKRRLGFINRDSAKIIGFFRLWSKLTRFHGGVKDALWRSCVDQSQNRNGVPLRVTCKEEDQPLYICLSEVKRIENILHIYNDFSMQYAAALQSYTNERAINKALQSFLRQNCEGALRGGTLESHLIRPIQRLCKYPLLLRAISGHLPVGSLAQTYASLKTNTIAEEVEELVQHVNLHKVQFEHMEKVLDTSSRLRVGEEEFPLCLAEPHRILFQATTMYSARSWEIESKSSRFILLYNDCIIISLPRRSLLNPGAKIYDVFNVLPLKDASFEEDYLSAEEMECSRALAITCPNWDVDLQPWILGFDECSSVDSEIWLKDLQKAIDFTSAKINRKRDNSVLEKLSIETNNVERKSKFVQAMLKHPKKAARVFGKVHQASAVVIQKTYRGILGRKRFEQAKLDFFAEVQAAIVIQRAFKKLHGLSNF